MKHCVLSFFALASLSTIAFAGETPEAGKPGVAALSQAIDRAIDKGLQAQPRRLRPMTRSSCAALPRHHRRDSLRREGRGLPRQHRSRQRAKLIDELFASPAYGRHGRRLAGLLVQADSNNRRVTFDALHGWLEKASTTTSPGTSSSPSW